jgi:serine/threonine-protein kinase
LRDGSLLRPWQNGDVVADRYEVLEFIGAGGMGLVYRCRDRRTSRVRALKTLRLDLDDEQRALVLRLLKSEAIALRRIESDFVVRLFDASVEPELSHPFVVMELLRGRDLEQVLKEGRPPRAQAMGWLWQAACGLKAIHGEGVVHRDLKPANLFLNERDDGSTELKILDFSISRLLDSATGRTTVIVGSKGFMSPEQAAGYDVDHRSDIFALGQVARALLEPTDAFRAWHGKATAADRRERFESATEAVEALALTLGVTLPGRSSWRPSDAALSTAATVLAPPVRRLRTWAFIGGSAALALGVTVITSKRSDNQADVARTVAASPGPPSALASAAQTAVPLASLAVSAPAGVGSSLAPVSATSSAGSARVPGAPTARMAHPRAPKTPRQQPAVSVPVVKASDNFW